MAFFAVSSMGFSPTPVPGPSTVLRASTPSMAVEDMIGKYSVKGTVFDPLNLATKYDVNWMREAELKHGRLCMLAVSGFLAVDGGIRFPGKAFEGISAVEAHDKMVRRSDSLSASPFCEHAYPTHRSSPATCGRCFSSLARASCGTSSRSCRCSIPTGRGWSQARASARGGG